MNFFWNKILKPFLVGCLPIAFVFSLAFGLSYSMEYGYWWIMIPIGFFFIWSCGNSILIKKGNNDD